MTYLPQGLEDTVRTKLTRAIASGRSNQPRRTGSIVYSVFVKDTARNLTFRVENLERVPDYVDLPKHFSRKLKLRIGMRRLRDGQIDFIQIAPRFKFSPNQRRLILLDNPDEIASGLELRFKRHLGANRRKDIRYRLYGHAPSIRPNEVVWASFQQFYWDGEGYAARAAHNYRRFERTWTGVRTPDYAKKKAEGTLPVNSHSVLMLRRTDYGSYFNQTVLYGPSEGHKSGYWDAYGYHLGTSDYGENLDSIAHSTKSRNKAISRARESALGESQNLAETVATMNQTFGMIGNSIGRLYRGIVNLKRGNFSGAIGELFKSNPPKFRKKGGPAFTKDLANNWLELQFGWKPLLQDIQFVTNTLRQFDAEGRVFATAKGSAKDLEVLQGVLKPNAIGDPPSVGNWASVQTTRTKFVIRFTISDPYRLLLSQAGFTNPLSLAWELLPFSFVVDWLLPIGSYLESLDQWGGLVFLDGSETNFTRKNVVYLRDYLGRDYPYGPEPVPTYETELYGAYEIEGIKLNRDKLTSFPGFTLPTIKNPFSTAHVLNGMALLRQVFRR